MIDREHEEDDKAQQQQLMEKPDTMKPWQKGAVERDKAIDQVERNASQVLKDELMVSVRNVAELQLRLTSDDVWKDYRIRMSVDPHEPRVLGAVMRSAGRAKWIVPTPDFMPSARPETHRSPKRVWHSLIFRGPK